MESNNTVESNAIVCNTMLSTNQLVLYSDDCEYTPIGNGLCIVPKAVNPDQYSQICGLSNSVYAPVTQDNGPCEYIILLWAESYDLNDRFCYCCVCCEVAYLWV